MALKTFAVGEVLTAGDVNEYLVNTKFARKSIAESVTSSTTLQDDDDLFVTVSASCTYELSGQIVYDGDTAGDLKVSWSYPTGTTMRWWTGRLTTGAAAETDNALSTLDESGTAIGGALGPSTTTLAVVVVGGIVMVSSTAGTFRLRWAQQASSATATRVHARSYICLRRVE